MMRMKLLCYIAAAAASAQGALAVNFPYETIQLTKYDVKNFSAIAFGDASSPNASYHGPDCKPMPGDPGWPLDEEWSRLNSSLGGALLKPSPPAAVCYPGPLYDATQCSYLLGADIYSSRFYLDDPVTVLTDWTEGNTCPAVANATGNCTQGGFPVYVVNATTVRHIQIAVNFARNKGLRLIIKNTGHDFNGRSAGAGSLSVWTHWLKSFEFLPTYEQDSYSGPAARVGSGLEGWEMFKYMDTYNVSLVVPGGYTVGAYGGWMAGGGHSTLASIYGLGADQALSIQVVTADGRFLTADPHQNTDLFYALRGGGPGTYGIVTSAIVKAYPAVTVSQSTVAFPSGGAQYSDIFWYGVSLVYYFGKAIVDAGGTAYSYVTPTGGGTYSFTNDIELPNKTPAEVYAFVQPLIDQLNAIGIAIRNPTPVSSTSWGDTRHGEGDAPGESRFATRLLPRENWDNNTIFTDTMTAIAMLVEAGYTFHGINMGPYAATEGYPGDNAVNPAFRKTLMHSDVFDTTVPPGSSAAVQIAAHEKFNAYMNVLRDVSPGAGAYVNEADVLEPNWQQSFWGDKYEKLLAIKKKHDPWSLFWAPTTVGSEGWAVRTSDGLPTQNGPLCKVQ